ncbi:hypothetical protein K501DRAFT_235288 [Backusella circina FSU 941]|nr:hypothetical protein K501DRAFT_235288 [Backusella circina FSU 941]
MGKVQKKSTFGNAKLSKHAHTIDDPDNAKTAKERVEAELRLLHARGQAITTKKQPTLHKVKKATTKKGVSVKKQKRLARALVVADKEEVRIEKQNSRAEKRKQGKSLWE